MLEMVAAFEKASGKVIFLSTLFLSSLTPVHSFAHISSFIIK